MTPGQRTVMRLIAIRDSAEEGIRILRSEESTAKRDVREAQKPAEKGSTAKTLKRATSIEATVEEATLKYDALLKRLADMQTTNQPPESAVHAEQPATPTEAESQCRELLEPLPTTNAPATEPADWDRWHELLDIKDERGLTPGEDLEYQRLARIAAQLDAEEGGAADAALDNLVREHGRVIASIKRLTAAVWAAAGKKQPPAPPTNSELREWARTSGNPIPKSWWNATDDPFKAAEPTPPIEIEMRVGQIGKGAMLTGYWIAGPTSIMSRSSSIQEIAIEAAEAWLAALGEQLGVKLVANWEGEDKKGQANGNSKD